MSKRHTRQSYGLVLEGEKLTVHATAQPGLFDPRFLIAALLHHVAEGDGRVCDREAAAMVELVADHLGLDAMEAEARLGQALSLYSQSLDLTAVGEVLQDILDEQERIEVMLMLLHVVAADGRQGADELRAVDEVAASLQITDEERHLAFQHYFDEQDEHRSGRRIHQQ